jgi:hypothetical protein
MTIPAATKIAELQALVASIPKYLGNVPLVIENQTYSPAEVVSVVNTVLESAMNVSTTKGAAHDALVADRKVQQQYATFMKALHALIGAAFGNSHTTLSDFAMKPRKKRALLSNEARLAANAKAKATRVARGTKGKRQRAAITGSVTGVTITPIVAGGAPATEGDTGGSGGGTPT